MVYFNGGKYHNHIKHILLNTLANDIISRVIIKMTTVSCVAGVK